MPTSQVNAITGQIFLVPGQLIINVPALIFSAPIGVQTQVTLASGDNTITIPTGTTYIIIQPPSANTQGLILKGAGGDTGVKMSKTLYHIYTPDPTQTNFIINAANNTAAPTVFTFI